MTEENDEEKFETTHGSGCFPYIIQIRGDGEIIKILSFSEFDEPGEVLLNRRQLRLFISQLKELCK